MMIETSESSSTRPYLIRALYEWCTDNGFTPFIAVLVDERVRVPNEFVKDGEIVLNISFDATSSLNIGNEFIEFKGRFGGVAHDIFVPFDRVLAIYARENGQGMAFPMLASAGEGADSKRPGVGDTKSSTLSSVGNSMDDVQPDKPRPPSGTRPSLIRVK